MWRLVNWFKKLFTGSRSGNASSAPGAPATNTAPATSRTETELEIDKVVSDFLPKMGNLINFQSSTKYWQSVFKALAFAESDFKLNSRYVETGLGKDAVTGVQNTSEGLLQLSYQDAKYHSCEFDWSVDKKLDARDLSKTIFNLRKNIQCGMIIMNKLIVKNGTYIFNSGNYWAVLKPNNSRHSVFKKKFDSYMKAQ